ncbi:MAG: chalcone synthase [bacterium]|nr:chalcone synthase [bacterium]
MSVLRSLVTATPPYDASQSEIRDVAFRLFPEYAESPRHAAIFANTGIARRQLARPLDWYATPRSFAEKNDAFVEVALELGEETARAALEASGVTPKDLGGILWVSTTGLRTPSPDATLAVRLGLPRDVRRMPLWGLGCAGGAGGLIRAHELVRSLDRPVLLVTVELCSLTFVRSDRSRSNFVGTALFGDGAAAAVLAPEGPGVRIQGGHAELFPDSEPVMGWDLTDAGLQVRFARDIPTIVRQELPGSVGRARELLAPGREIAHHVVHPGGTKVLSAYAEALDLPLEALSASHEVLAAHGNMSGPSVLFVLERTLARSGGLEGTTLMTALGPGFAVEHAVLEP